MGQKIDLVGMRFGRLVVICESPKRDRSGSVSWTVVCDCGNTREVSSSSLRKGLTRSCGCYHNDIMKTQKSLSGQKIGRLTVYEKILDGKRPLYRCVCDCGKERYVGHRHLEKRETLSCGCYNRDNKTIHGMSKTKEYRAWQKMKERCYNPKYTLFSRYGGRGISVCDRWIDSFENFYADMGSAPAGTSIDRIDNDGIYEPSNCRWATSEVQANNKSSNRKICINGEEKTVAEWSDVMGVRSDLIHCRLGRGWSDYDAVTRGCVNDNAD